MRWLLALALVLHLSGVPAAVAQPCQNQARAGHSCCEPTRTDAGASVGPQLLAGPCGCGCRVTSLPESPAPGVLSTPPETTPTTHTAAVLLADAPVTPGSACLGPGVHPPPVSPDPSANSSFLSGAGFRC